MPTLQPWCWKGSYAGGWLGCNMISQEKVILSHFASVASTNWSLCQLAMLPTGFVVPVGKDGLQPFDAYVNTSQSMGKDKCKPIDANVKTLHSMVKHEFPKVDGAFVNTSRQWENMSANQLMLMSTHFPIQWEKEKRQGWRLCQYISSQWVFVIDAGPLLGFGCWNYFVSVRMCVDDLQDHLC